MRMINVNKTFYMSNAHQICLKLFNQQQKIIYSIATVGFVLRFSTDSSLVTGEINGKVATEV